MIKVKCEDCNGYWVVPGVKSQPNYRLLFQRSCNYFAMSERLMTSPRRLVSIVYPRFMLIHALYYNEKLNFGIGEISQLLKKDHSTICKNLDRFLGLLQTDENLVNQLKDYHLFLYGHLKYCIIYDESRVSKKSKRHESLPAV